MKTMLTAVAVVTLVTSQVLSVASPALAQTASQAKEGDYYAPSNTVVQQSTPQELNAAKEGDYYAPGKTVVQQPTLQEQSQAREGDYYAPKKGD